jgi:hypothetical protein
MTGKVRNLLSNHHDDLLSQIYQAAPSPDGVVAVLGCGLRGVEATSLGQVLLVVLCSSKPHRDTQTSAEPLINHTTLPPPPPR